MTMRVHSDFRICKLKSSVSPHAPLHDDEGAITLHNLQLEVFTSPTFPVTGAVLHSSMIHDDEGGYCRGRYEVVSPPSLFE